MPSDKLIGETLGDFRLEELLGKGASGRVFRATQLSLHRSVALKVLEDGMFTPDDKKLRFLREAALIAQLEHPNIVPVYAAGHRDNIYYFAMRLIKGENLAQRMREGLPLYEGLRYMADVCRALDCAHARGMLHRDVKPANIMIADGAAVLTDFGLARLTQGDTSKITVSGAMVGTPSYMSPEQARCEEATAKSDLFSVGIILYEMATGRHPFAPARATGSAMASLLDAVAQARFDPPRTIAPDLSPRLEQILLKSLQLDPAKRPASAQELQRDLESPSLI